MSFSQKLPGRGLIVALLACWFALITLPVFSQSSTDVVLTQDELACLADKKVLGACVDSDRLFFDGARDQDQQNGLSKDFFKNNKYLLLWQALVVIATILIVSLYWNRRLTRANRKTHETLSELHTVQADLKDQTRLFKEQSITDALTGLYNRIKLDDDIAYAIKRSKRINSEFSIILLDIDDFKQVNDTYGHVIGDLVLKAIAPMLKKAIRESDIIGRWGGEKFLIICPDTDSEGCQVLAERLLLRIEKCKFPEIGHIRASFGVTTYAEDDRADTVVARVDKALYCAKEGGRNRVEVG
jgi:diguanylate cyclase (GGDEF)-like protein